MFYCAVGTACIHFAGYIKTGPTLNEQFVGGNIAFYFSSFADIEQFCDVQYAFETAFDDEVWEVIVEPDVEEQTLVVVTAYPVN